MIFTETINFKILIFFGTQRFVFLSTKFPLGLGLSLCLPLKALKGRVIDFLFGFWYDRRMLEPKDEVLLEHTYEIEKENNQMLKKMYHGMVWGRIFRIVYWVFVLAFMLGAYYYVQPYIGSAIEKYNAFMVAVNSIPTGK